jgi:predicted nucleic-acid-binding protein
VIGLNTNVLVRYLVQDDPDQAARATRFIERRCTADEPGFVNHMVLCEIVWVLESVYRLARSEVAAIVDRMLRVVAFEIEDFPLALAALQLYRDGACDFADALIGLRNRRHGCSATATFDRRAARLDAFVAVP